MNFETIAALLNLLENVDRNLARIADALDDMVRPPRVDQTYPGTDADVTPHRPYDVWRDIHGDAEKPGDGSQACGDTPNSQG